VDKLVLVPSHITPQTQTPTLFAIVIAVFIRPASIIAVLEDYKK
jgi:hypothetical protein